MTLIKQLRRSSRLFRPESHEAADRIEELEAENEALRKDAERYQWLSDYFVNEDFDLINYDVNNAKSTKELDAAIDAAMSNRKELNEI